MMRDTHTHEPTRTVPGYTAPLTWTGLAMTAVLAAAFPLAFLALAHPATVATLTLAAGAAGAVLVDGADGD